MILKIFVIVLALPSLIQAKDQPSKEERLAVEQDQEKERAPRSFLPSRYRSKTQSFGQISLELAKLHLIEETLKKSKSLNDFREEVNEHSEDKCSKIKKVGDPIVHHHSGTTQGTWMRDPLGVLGAQKIWYMNGYYGRQLLEFDSMDYFKAGMVSKTYNLPYNVDGTGSVVYGRYLYFNRAGTKYIVQYDLVTETVTRQAIPYTSAIVSRKYYYQWGGYNTFDLSIDESGLWVLFSYSGYSGKLCASQLDPLTLTTLHTYCGISSESMKTMGNAFVACGIVYSIDSYSGTTTINYAFNTVSSQRSNPGIQFKNSFGYNSMVTYNPREKVLYAWDNRRQVTYPLEFETKQ